MIALTVLRAATLAIIVAMLLATAAFFVALVCVTLASILVESLRVRRRRRKILSRLRRAGPVPTAEIPARKVVL